jgi:hypothetical protein
VLQPALDELRQFARRGLAVQHGLEGLRAHIRVGHAGVGELADVGGDAVQLLEGLLPRHRAGAARRDERAVDVEQEDSGRLGCHQSSLSSSRPRASSSTTTLRWVPFG